MSSQKYYLCVTPFFPSPDNWRGAYVLDQVKAIRRNSDYRIIVFRPCGLLENGKSYECDGIEVHSVSSWFMPSYFFNGLGGGINGRNFVRKLKQLNISLYDIAVCHCHTAAFACFASALKRVNPQIKTVMQYHDLDPYQVRLGKFSHWRPNITYRVKKFVGQFRYIDLHLCISRRVKYNLEHFPIPHPQEYFEPYVEILKSARHLHVPSHLNTYVLYNGVDVTMFHRIDGIKKRGVFKIGCISNFNVLKDHMTLIRAIESIVKENPDANIAVSFLGSGETKSSCLEYIKTHALERYFVFEVEVSHDKLPIYFNSLDLFVLPSYFEGFGCVYTEAAACGVPFMGCYGQGYSEYIPEKDREHWLIEPHDFKRLAVLIKRQMKNQSEQALAYPYDINLLVKAYLSHLVHI